MSTKVWGNINVGLILGLLQFVSTFAITGWYVSYSNRKLDPIAADIRHGIEGHEFDRRQPVSGAANEARREVPAVNVADDSRTPPG